MKLTHISIQNVAGVSSAQVATAAPITIVAGRNGHGKSSFAQAVRMALTGDTTARGITLKKELGSLVHDGAKAGEVLLTCAAGLPELYAMVPSGKTTPLTEYTPHLAMPFVTSPELFAQLAPTARRGFLFDLMGLSASGPVVVERLLAKGCDRAKIDRVLPMLRSGFDAASKEAKSQATQAKGAWRAVTGETCGAVKASEWKAVLPSAVAEGEPTDTAKLRACEAALESWQQQVGKLQAEQQRRAELSSRLAGLDEQAGRIASIERKLATDKQELATQTARLDTLAASATGVRVGLVHDLAKGLNDCLGMLIPVGDMSPAGRDAMAAAEDALDRYTMEHGSVRGDAGDPAAAAALPALRQSVEMLRRAIGNDNRDLATAERAKTEAEAIRAELAKPAGTGLAEAGAQVERLKAERAAITKAIDAAAAVKRAAAEAKEKTAKAAQHHADVIAWDAIGDALAPDGIPGEMLAEALDPINERLARSALDAEWPRVGIESDMSISVGDGARPYALCSESEKWRADAMLAEAISHLSGLKLLVLDRFDVLDLPGRSDLIAWLDILAADGEIDTALLCGTLKALPTGLPDTVAAHWIERGRLNGSASRELVAEPAAPDQVEDGAADPMQRLLADAYRLGLNEAGLPGPVVAEMMTALEKGLYITDIDAMRAEFSRGVSDAWQRDREVAAAPLGESLPVSAAAPVSPACAADARSGTADGGQAQSQQQSQQQPTLTNKNSELKRQAEQAAQRRANGGKPLAVYRHPDGMTWTGRGLQPAWMAKAISEGKSPAYFLI